MAVRVLITGRQVEGADYDQDESTGFYFCGWEFSLGLGLEHMANLKQDKTLALDSQFDPWLEIDRKLVKENVSQVQKRVGSRPIMAVIKCNAYGHGLVEFSRALSDCGVRHFAVVKVREALDLRKSGNRDMVLNFGAFSASEAELLVKWGISQSVFSDTIDWLAAASRRLQKKARVHIKVDTGLGRVGVPYSQAIPFIEKVASMPEITIEGIFTTLTEEPDFDIRQIERLKQILPQAKKKGISLGITHAASSLAIAHDPHTFLDMVRPGNCLYGLEPLPNMELKQCLSLKTRVLYTKSLKPGDTIAYHQAFKINKNTLLATLPLGYSDGYPTQGVGKAQVLIQGRRWPMVAYMSANHVFVDITGSQGIQIGDEVVLIGKQQEQEISISEVARWTGSSVYRIPIGMNPQLPRLFM